MPKTPSVKRTYVSDRVTSYALRDLCLFVTHLGTGIRLLSVVGNPRYNACAEATIVDILSPTTNVLNKHIAVDSTYFLAAPSAKNIVDLHESQAHAEEVSRVFSSCGRDGLTLVEQNLLLDDLSRLSLGRPVAVYASCFVYDRPPEFYAWWDTVLKLLGALRDDLGM